MYSKSDATLRKLKFNLIILWKRFLFLLIKNKHLECYPVQETTVFQLLLAHLKRKQINNPPKSHFLYLEIPSPAQIET